MAIGARSQSARTYLEKHFDEFLDCDLEPLVAHGLRALRDTLPNEVDLSNKVRTFIDAHNILIDLNSDCKHILIGFSSPFSVTRRILLQFGSLHSFQSTF